MARADKQLEPPIRAHDRVTKRWETDQIFLTPESVLYDAEREVLYVSNFDNRFAETADFTGYISRLSPDGEVLDHEWIGELNAPTGMGIFDGKLYVLERGVLTAIDIDAGVITERIPIPDAEFLNDLAIDGDGSIYMSDTRPSSWVDSRIYRYADGTVDLWLGGEEINGANGLFVNGEELLVGNSGDGMLRAVGLEDKRVRDITCLGAGVIDGIRLTNDGRYIVSHWEGQTYLVAPTGEVLEIMDTIGAANSADFEYIAERNLLVVPTFVDNRVVAYNVRED